MTQIGKDFWNESIDAEEQFGCEVLNGSLRGAIRSGAQRQPNVSDTAAAQEIIPVRPVGKADEKIRNA